MDHCREDNNSEPHQNTEWWWFVSEKPLVNTEMDWSQLTAGGCWRTQWGGHGWNLLEIISGSAPPQLETDLTLHREKDFSVTWPILRKRDGKTKSYAATETMKKYSCYCRSSLQTTVGWLKANVHVLFFSRRAALTGAAWGTLQVAVVSMTTIYHYHHSVSGWSSPTIRLLLTCGSFWHIIKPPSHPISWLPGWWGRSRLIGFQHFKKKKKFWRFSNRSALSVHTNQAQLWEDVMGSIFSPGGHVHSFLWEQLKNKVVPGIWRWCTCSYKVLRRKFVLQNVDSNLIKQLV